MKMNCMEFVRQSITMVTFGGGSTKMALEKVSIQVNVQMKESAIISSRIIMKTVMELKHNMMEKYIEESSKMTTMTVMDSISI